MKFKLSTWNAILLGPCILAAQFLTTTGTSPANRAVAAGLLFFLAPSVLVLLVVDGIVLRRYLKTKKE